MIKNYGPKNPPPGRNLGASFPSPSGNLKNENQLSVPSIYIVVLDLETILKALEAFNQLVATERWGATDIAFLPTNDDFDPKYVDCRYTYVDSNFQGCPPTKAVQNPVEILLNLWVSFKEQLIIML